MNNKEVIQRILGEIKDLRTAIFDEYLNKQNKKPLGKLDKLQGNVAEQAVSILNRLNIAEKDLINNNIEGIGKYYECKEEKKEFDKLLKNDHYKVKGDYRKKKISKSTPLKRKPDYDKIMAIVVWGYLIIGGIIAIIIVVNE